MAITEKADIFTIAQYGNLIEFKKCFIANDINTKNSNGSSLLHLAIAGKNIDIALFLVSSGIDVNIKNKDNQNALALLCNEPYQNIDLAKLIIEKGIDINNIDKYGNNATWTSVFNCKGRNYEMVELIIKNKGDYNNKNKAGRSALDFAKQVENEKLINIIENLF